MLQSFLGLRWEQSALMVDPVIPKGLNGLRVEMKLGGIPFEVTYHIEDSGCSTKVVRLNGVELSFRRDENPYRIGAARVPMAAVRKRLTTGVNQLAVELG
jgi:cellobiose phosphorylase